MSFKVGRVMNSRIFDSLPDFIEFVRGFRIPKVDVEKRRLEIRGKDWYLSSLGGKRVVGVDGSQIRHLREFGVPYGAVQVARFVVTHGRGDYQLDFKSKWIGLEQNIDFERFSVEVEAIVEEMKGGRGYIFYDGSFILSFVSQFRKDLRESYLDLLNLMLERSEETSTPLFGFVERSYARDISENYHDSIALKDSLSTFEYTEPSCCEREVTKDYRKRVYFSYLCLNKLPVRVEFPEWMVDGANEFMKVVAAECMLGSTKNYPYVLERAHRYAVIRETEREAIGRVLSKFSGASLKWVSKRMRV
jgi:hypothetical protein